MGVIIKWNLVVIWPTLPCSKSEKKVKFIVKESHFWPSVVIVPKALVFSVNASRFWEGFAYYIYLRFYGFYKAAYNKKGRRRIPYL